jgi:uncharacterized membrane protein YgaE (UPF0421/DUF939 family)
MNDKNIEMMSLFDKQYSDFLNRLDLIELIHPEKFEEIRDLSNEIDKKISKLHKLYDIAHEASSVVKQKKSNVLILQRIDENNKKFLNIVEQMNPSIGENEDKNKMEGGRSKRSRKKR